MPTTFTDQIPVLKISRLVREGLAGLLSAENSQSGILEVEWSIGENQRIQRIPLVASPCRFGGTRLYFRCPTITCGKRVTKLYRKDRSFRCRQCHGLRYRTQYMRPIDRLIARRDKLASRLDVAPFESPLRPRGMWNSTFQRMIGRIEAVERELDWQIAVRFNGQ